LQQFIFLAQDTDSHYLLNAPRKWQPIHWNRNSYSYWRQCERGVIALWIY